MSDATPSTLARRDVPAQEHVVPFGVNEVRLNLRQWCLAGILLIVIAALTPSIWRRVERLETGPDYRIPYSLSKDYWLYARRLHEVADPSAVFVVGDSVIWGEYVLPDGTLSHFLNQEAGTNRFVNAGVNGLFPLAIEGLISDYARSIGHRKVILHCNPLWMSSRKADLSIDKEESFNHSRLVAQFIPAIPCYRADFNERLGAVIERKFGFFQWVNHLQSAYFDQMSIPRWTLADDGGEPPAYPNAMKNPLRQITFRVPGPPLDDPERGPRSPRHRPWPAGSARRIEFDWVTPDSSLQWKAFQRATETLRARGAEVFVVVGPFNTSMLGDKSQPGYRQLHQAIGKWLADTGIPHLLPEALPSELYADASHPLTEGYALLAKRLWSEKTLRTWLGQ
jgi:hypothetical protein